MNLELDQLLDRHGLTRGKLVAALHDLPADRRDGDRWFGDWTVKDIVCHISAREDACAAALEAFARGRPPKRPGHDGDDEAFNRKLALEHRDDSWDEAMQFFDATRHRLLTALLGLYGLDPESYAGGTEVRERMDLTGHEQEHTGAIVAWREEHGL